MKTALLLMGLALASGAWAAPSCKITNFGILKPAQAKSIKEAPGTASGAHRVFDRVEIEKRTDRVPARLGLRFGVQHQFRDIPKGEQLTLYIDHPELTAPSGAKATASESRKSPTSNGTSWGFYDHSELVPGKYQFDFRYKGKSLCKKAFTVVKE
jgi:hypothetical protein